MNADWISIKKCLPAIGQCLIVTVYDHIRNRRELRYPVFYRQNTYSGGYGFYMYGADEYVLLPEISEVIAWIHMPNVYDGEISEDDN